MTSGGGPTFLWDDAPSNVEEGLPREPVAARAGLPAEPGLWVFVLGDMTIFGLFFTVFSWEGRGARELYAQSAEQLIQPIGVANTLVLLISSYFVVLALHAHRTGRHAIASRFVVGAIVCAAAFASFKVVEYTTALGSGHTPSTNVFFTFYYVMTGVHLLHVVIGAALLLIWRSRLRRTRTFSESRRLVEGSAVYWHMVDLLWILIFTLLYLASAP